jgi:hypothetical protein
MMARQIESLLHTLKSRAISRRPGGFVRSTGVLARFARAETAIVAVEFAIIMPTLIMFTLGAGEVSRYVNVTRELTNLAYAEADLVAERPSGSATMSILDIVFVEEATPINFPAILPDAARKGYSGNQGWSNDIQFTISSVIFSPTVTGCTSSCTYKGAVAWSLSSNASPRSCSTAPTSVADGMEPSLTTLPADVFTSGSLIVVDLAYTFTPVFGSAFFPTVTLRRSAYLQPRYLSSVSYSGPMAC